MNATFVFIDIMIYTKYITNKYFDDKNMLKNNYF